MEFSGRHFEWTFLLAEVIFAILRAEFVKHFNLVVDLDLAAIQPRCNLSAAVHSRCGNRHTAGEQGTFWGHRGDPLCLRRRFYRVPGRVSFETSFDSKQLKLEPKLVSALSETKRLFRLFRFYTETESFDVSIEPKQTKDQPKQFDREHILQFFTENLWFYRFFRFFLVFFRFFLFFSRFFWFVSILSKQFVSVFRLFRFYTETESFD